MTPSSTRTTGWKPITADSRQRLRPMRGVKMMRSLRIIAAGHAFVQNLRRGQYEITIDLPAHDRVRVAFTDLAHCL